MPPRTEKKVPEITGIGDPVAAEDLVSLKYVKVWIPPVLDSEGAEVTPGRYTWNVQAKFAYRDTDGNEINVNGLGGAYTVKIEDTNAPNIVGAIRSAIATASRLQDL